MGCKKNPVYVNLLDDQYLASMASGAVRKYIVTPKGYWALMLGAEKFMVGAAIEGIETNAGITAKWQWSLDGANWLDGDTLVTEKTANGTHTGILTNANQMTPFGRVVIEVRDTMATEQVGATLSIWGYYQYA